MHPVFCRRPFEYEQDSKDSNRLDTLKCLRSPLYLKTLHHFRNSVCHVVILLLGPVGQTPVVQGYRIVWVDRLGNGYQLFLRIVTSVAVRVDLMTTAVASLRRLLVRLSVRYGIIE